MELRCASAESIVRVLRFHVDNTTALFAEAAGAIAVGIAFAGLMSAVGVGLIFTGAATFGEVVAFSTAFYSAAAVGLNTFFDFEFYDDFKCVLFANCPESGVWDETSKNSLVADCSSRSGVVWSLATRFISLMPVGGLNNSAHYFDAEIPSDCSDCPEYASITFTGDILSDSSVDGVRTMTIASVDGIVGIHRAPGSGIEVQSIDTVDFSQSGPPYGFWFFDCPNGSTSSDSEIMAPLLDEPRNGIELHSDTPFEATISFVMLSDCIPEP